MLPQKKQHHFTTFQPFQIIRWVCLNELTPVWPLAKQRCLLPHLPFFVSFLLAPFPPQPRYQRNPSGSRAWTESKHLQGRVCSAASLLLGLFLLFCLDVKLKDAFPFWDLFIQISQRGVFTTHPKFPPSRQLQLWLWLLPLDAPSPNSGGLHSHDYAWMKHEWIQWTLMEFQILRSVLVFFHWTVASLCALATEQAARCCWASKRAWKGLVMLALGAMVALAGASAWKSCGLPMPSLQNYTNSAKKWFIKIPAHQTWTSFFAAGLRTPHNKCSQTHCEASTRNKGILLCTVLCP